MILHGSPVAAARGVRLIVGVVSVRHLWHKRVKVNSKEGRSVGAGAQLNAKGFVAHKVKACVGMRHANMGRGSRSKLLRGPRAMCQAVLFLLTVPKRGSSAGGKTLGSGGVRHCRQRHAGAAVASV